MELPNQEKDCRACMTVEQLMKRARDLVRSKQEPRVNEGDPFQAGPSKNIEEPKSVPPHERKDCPLNTEQLGRSTWDLLHTMAAYYPEKPSEKDKSDMRTFVNTLGKVYPCPHCAEGLRDHLEKYPPNLKNREEFSIWMCEMHNKVSEKLGKPKFDCSYWKERWLSGWKDGSCEY